MFDCSLFEGQRDPNCHRDIRKSVKKSWYHNFCRNSPQQIPCKIASDWNKPDGQSVIKPEQVKGFLKDLPVKKLHGVGKVMS